jgi:hypothetical protein
MISATGDTALAIWRPARPAASGTWTVVMMGGLGTGDRAALLLPAGLPVNALAVDWPWRGPRRLGPLQFALRLPAIREAVLRSPAVLARGVEACARTRGTDPSRLVLLGASLGVPPALAALRIGRPPAALVLLDGGTDLGLLIRIGLEREGVARPLAGPLAALAARLIRPLEPALNAAAARGLPVLLVNGDRDLFLPRRSIDRLWAALPHATRRWRSGPHVRPDRPETLAALSREALAWLEGAVPGNPAR